jgi:hypothetical protein
VLLTATTRFISSVNKCYVFRPYDRLQALYTRYLPRIPNVNSEDYLRLQMQRFKKVYLTFIGPCIANIFAQYNQQDATYHNLFISVRRCTCFRRVFRPSSGVQNCTYSVRPLLLPAATLPG